MCGVTELRTWGWFSWILIGVALSCARASSIDDFAASQNTLRAPAVGLARRAVETYLKTGKTISPPRDLPALFRRNVGAFVTMSKDGRRKGCKGTFEPAAGNLAEEIIRAAIGAAAADRRYRPIRANELADLIFTVSIIGPLKRVRESDGYSTRDYGLLLRTASSTGVILPGEAKTASWRLAEAKRQAGMRAGQSYELFVFKTVALREDAKRPRR